MAKRYVDTIRDTFNDRALRVVYQDNSHRRMGKLVFEIAVDKDALSICSMH